MSETDLKEPMTWGEGGEDKFCIFVSVWPTSYGPPQIGEGGTHTSKFEIKKL